MADIQGLIYSFNKVLYDELEVPYGYHINYLMSHDTSTVDDFQEWLEVDLIELGDPRDLGSFTIQLTCYSKIAYDPNKTHILTMTDRILTALGFSSMKTVDRYTFDDNGEITGTNGTLTLIFQSMNQFDRTPEDLHNQIIIEYMVMASNICIEDNINNMKMTQVIGENKFG